LLIYTNLYNFKTKFGLVQCKIDEPTDNMCKVAIAEFYCICTIISPKNGTADLTVVDQNTIQWLQYLRLNETSNTDT